MMKFESTGRQRQMIGYLRKLLRIPNDLYYEIIYNDWNVNSSKDLSYNAAEELIKRLKKQAIAQGIYDPKKSNYDKYSGLYGRYGMATPAQCRKINILWKYVSNQTTDELKEKALNSFLRRITGKERMSFLTQSDCSKVIKAIEKMLEQKQQKEITA